MLYVTVEAQASQLTERETMIRYPEDKALVDSVIAQFPPIFGLAAFPADVFRISQAHSYVNDSKQIMLYTERFVNGRWESFCKGTPGELLHAYRYLKFQNGPAGCVHSQITRDEKGAISCLYCGAVVAGTGV